MKLDNDMQDMMNSILWFEKCGIECEIPLKYYGYEFISLEQVCTCIDGIKWENIQTDEFNNLYDWFKTTHVFMNWNTTVDQIKKDIIPEIDKLAIDKIKNIFGNNSKKIITDFNYDLLLIIIKSLIVKQLPSDTAPHFLGEIFKVYQSGHFPCGWKGKYPRGNMLIF